MPMLYCKLITNLHHICYYALIASSYSPSRAERNTTLQGNPRGPLHLDSIPSGPRGPPYTPINRILPTVIII